jgi:rhodanese-related sulfurtransferase
MKKIDKIIIALLLVGGAVSVFLKDMKPITKVISEEELLKEVSRETKYITTDEVAKMIMEKDPSLLLIDVRSPGEYKKFTLEGAVNIPLDNLLDESNLAYYDTELYTPVLFSNGDTYANEALLILASYDYKGLKVMKGGLNRWYRTILNPLPPDEKTMTGTDWKTYLFRKGAQIYFTGIQTDGTAQSPAQAKPKVKPVVKRKKKEVTGGCG